MNNNPLIVVTKPPTRLNKIIIALLVTLVIVLGATVFILLKRTNTATLTQELPAQTTKTVVTPTTPVVDTTSWLTFTDTAAGFTFKYPEAVLINKEDSDPNQLIMNVSVEKLSDIPEDLPSFMGRNDALKQKEDLTQSGGVNIKKIGSLNGQISASYSQFEICSVFFSRELTFYPGEYRVILTISGPEEKIMADMPDFFTTDQTNCGSNLIWNQNNKSDFETTLSKQQGLGMAQEWYNTFYAITDTLLLITPSISTTVNGTTYTNEEYSFELTYSSPYKLLIDKDNLYGYPQGIALLYTGGQAYDIVIEAWDTQSAYEKEYSARMSDLTIFKSNGKFITFLNNTNSSENQQIINSVKVLE